MADYLGFQYTTVSRAVTLFVVSLLPSSVDDSVQFYDTEFEGVPVRVYLPLNKLDNSRAVVYFHGGGFRLGDIGLLQFFSISVCIYVGFIKRESLKNLPYLVKISGHTGQDISLYITLHYLFCIIRVNMKLLEVFLFVMMLYTVAIEIQ